MQELNRSFLVDTLTRLTPALSAQDFIPVLSHYCFDNGEGIVYTFNDVMALAVISEELASLDCAIGKPFLKLLSTYKDEKVCFSFEGEEEKLLMKCGRSKVKVPYLLPDVFIFNGPGEEQDAPDVSFEIEDSFITGLKTIIPFMGEDLLHPITLGVSVVVPGVDHIHLFVTDNRTVTRYIDKETEVSPDMGIGAFLLPKFFCEALVSWWEHYSTKEDTIILQVDDSSAKVIFPDGFIYTKLPYKATPEVLEDVLERHLPSSFEDDCVPIPEKLIEVLNRAQIIKASSIDKRITIGVEEGILSLLGSTEGIGELSEDIALDFEDLDVDSFGILVDVFYKAVTTLKDGDLLFLDECLAVLTEDTTHLINISSVEEGEE